MYHNTKFQPASVVIQNFGLPIKITSSLLGCSISDIDFLQAVYSQDAQGDLLVLYHYEKDQQSPPPASVAHVRGHVIEYRENSTRLVCRSIPVPVEIEDMETPIEGAVIVFTHGNTRIRVFHALGRIWYSTHRSLDCREQVWIENDYSFGELLALSPKRPIPPTNMVHTFNLQPGKPDSGHISWFATEEGRLLIANQMTTVVPKNISLGEYNYAIIYQPVTEKCFSVSSSSFKSERDARGNAPHIYAAYEKFLRSDEESFPYIREEQAESYKAAKERFIRKMASTYHRRNAGLYARVDPGSHRFLLGLQGKPSGLDKNSITSYIREQAADTDPEVISNLVLQFM